MSALPVPTSRPGDLAISRGLAVPSAAKSDPSPWLTLEECARLLGRSKDGLRYEARESLAPRGLARQAAGKNGRTAWTIHRSAYPELLRSHVLPAAGDESLPAAISTAAQLAAAPPEKRKAAALKAQFLARFRAWRVRPGVHVRRDFPAWSARTAAELGLDSIPSRSQTYTWHDLCPPGGAAGDDLSAMTAALLDGRRGPQDSVSRVSKAAWEHFEALYLDPRQPSIASCHRDIARVAHANGWDWPGLSRVRELVAQRIPPQRADLHRLGRDAWRKKHETPIEQDPDAFAAGECWEGDHSNLDFFVRVFQGGRWVARRPWLTAWFDRRSRLLCGWTVSMEHNTRTIAAALLSAFRSGLSVPRLAWLDNGKDYASAALHGLTRKQRIARRNELVRRGNWSGDAEPYDAERQITERGLLGMLSIETHFAQPYNHNGKARIERFFGIVHNDFDRRMPSYCGRGPGGPGAIDPERRADVEKNVMELPTLEEAAGAFDQWARLYNTNAERRIEDLDGLSPLEFYTRHLFARRVAEEGAVSLLSLEWAQPRVVSKHGVAVKIGDRTYRYGGGHPLLAPLVATRREVLVAFDGGPSGDVRSVKIFDDTGRFLCDAPMNTRHGGVTRDPVRKHALTEAQAKRREAERIARRRPDVSALALSDLERAALTERERQAASVERSLRSGDLATGDLAPLKLVHTPLDGQSKAVQAAAEESARLHELAEEQAIDAALDLDELLVEETHGAAAPAASDVPDESGGDDEFEEDPYEDDDSADPDLDVPDLGDDEGDFDDDFYGDDEPAEAGGDDADAEYDETDLADFEPAHEARR